MEIGTKEHYSTNRNMDMESTPMPMEIPILEIGLMIISMAMASTSSPMDPDMKANSLMDSSKEKEHFIIKPTKMTISLNT